MKRWKKILLGVVGVVGIGLATWGTANAVSIRNGPSGNSRQENVAIALLDVLNTDGTFNTLTVTTLSPTTLTVTGDATVAGKTTLGAGSKHDGFIVLDAGELTTTAAVIGTVASFSLGTGTDTYFVEAWIVGQGATETAVRGAYYATGTFFIDSDNLATVMATGTVWATESSHAPALDAYLLVNGTGVDVRVVGSATAAINWATTVRYINVSHE